MKLLALDTASDWYSAALWNAGEICSREIKAERGHGGAVLAMVDELFAESGLALSALDAIAFGRGPGAFTGLRLAASLTQGLAFAAGLPVIPVSDLRALAQQVMTAPASSARALVCHDARMGEVYWAGFENIAGHACPATAEAVSRAEDMIEAALTWLEAKPAAGVGSGLAVYPRLGVLAAQLAPVLTDARPHAREIARLAAADGLAASVPPEQALPVYVRDNVAVIPGPLGSAT